jgi:hypothetical protein
MGHGGVLGQHDEFQDQHGWFVENLLVCPHLQRLWEI